MRRTYRCCVRYLLVLIVGACLACACGEVTESPDDPIPAGDFSDNAFEQFAEGTFMGTEWAGDHVQLAAGQQAGEFLSRVFDAEADSAAWTAISWRTRAPHGKPLPGQEGRETGYTQDNIDMTGNVVLLHFDEAQAMSEGAILTDTSGRDNHAIVGSGGALQPVPGKVDGALSDSIDSHAYIDLATTRDLDFGTGDFTWALWAQTTQDCVGNKVFLGGDGAGAERVHLWLGCTDSEANSNCPDGEPGGRAGGTFRSIHNANEGPGFCGASRINDGEWHHIAIVKAGHAPATLTVYVDGAAEQTVQLSFIDELTFANMPHFTIGTFTTGGSQYQAAGAFDEIAIWRRALSGDEMASLYRRGALRLRFQVRICGEAACSTPSSFLGPGLDSNAFFVDREGPQVNGNISAAIDALSGRYFQYKASFESDIVGDSPFLDAVILTVQE